MRGNKVEGRLNEVVHDLLIAMHLPARQPPGNRNLQRDRGALMAWRFYASLLLELMDGWEEEMLTLTRRSLLKTAAMATTAIAVPFVRGAHAGGKLSCGFWDHWVPGANEPLAKLCREWADKEKVDLKIDFITTQGDKLNMTIAAEAQAKSGHDVLQMGDWYAAAQADNLEPVDELVNSLIAEHGRLAEGSEYIGRQ